MGIIEDKSAFLLIPRMMAAGNKGDIEGYEAAFSLIKELEVYESSIVRDKRMTVPDHIVYNEENFKKAHEYASDLRVHVARAAEGENTERMYKLYRNLLQFDAPHDFDCFCRFIEWDREPEKRFYQPRRKQLLPLAQALQRLEERKTHLLCISMPPGTGKTTLAEFCPG